VRPPCFLLKRHVAARAVDVAHELTAPQLHELVDPNSSDVECSMIGRLLLHGGEQPEQLDLLVPALGPTRDGLRQAQYGTGVKPQRARLEAVVSNMLALRAFAGASRPSRSTLQQSPTGRPAQPCADCAPR
jgi:hypothetical protein